MFKPAAERIDAVFHIHVKTGEYEAAIAANCAAADRGSRSQATTPEAAGIPPEDVPRFAMAFYAASIVYRCPEHVPALFTDLATANKYYERALLGYDSETGSA